jgi:hypothetical protein
VIETERMAREQAGIELRRIEAGGAKRIGQAAAGGIDGDTGRELG